MSNLRKRMRAKASEELDGLVVKLQVKAAELVAGVNEISGTDLLKLAAGGRTDTLKDKMVTRLTDHHENQLEAFFNDQQELLPESPVVEVPKGKSK